MPSISDAMSSDLLSQAQGFYLFRTDYNPLTQNVDDIYYAVQRGEISGKMYAVAGIVNALYGVIHHLFMIGVKTPLCILGRLFVVLGKIPKLSKVFSGSLCPYPINIYEHTLTIFKMLASIVLFTGSLIYARGALKPLILLKLGKDAMLDKQPPPHDPNVPQNQVPSVFTAEQAKAEKKSTVSMKDYADIMLKLPIADSAKKNQEPLSEEYARLLFLSTIWTELPPAVEKIQRKLRRGHPPTLEDRKAALEAIRDHTWNEKHLNLPAKNEITDLLKQFEDEWNRKTDLTLEEEHARKNHLRYMIAPLQSMLTKPLPFIDSLGNDLGYMRTHKDQFYQDQFNSLSDEELLAISDHDKYQKKIRKDCEADYRESESFKKLQQKMKLSDEDRKPIDDFASAEQIKEKQQKPFADLLTQIEKELEIKNKGKGKDGIKMNYNFNWQLSSMITGSEVTPFKMLSSCNYAMQSTPDSEKLKEKIIEYKRAWIVGEYSSHRVLGLIYAFEGTSKDLDLVTFTPDSVVPPIPNTAEMSKLLPRYTSGSKHISVVEGTQYHRWQSLTTTLNEQLEGRKQSSDTDRNGEKGVSAADKVKYTIDALHILQGYLDGLDLFISENRKYGECQDYQQSRVPACFAEAKADFQKVSNQISESISICQDFLENPPLQDNSY